MTNDAGDNLALPPLRELPAYRRYAHRRLMQSAVSGKVRTGRLFSRGAIAVGAAGALVLSGGVAGAYVAFAPATDKSGVRCYSVPSLRGGDHFWGTDVSMAAVNSSDPVAIQNAVKACALPWRDGVLTRGARGAHGPYHGSGAKTYPVPKLTPCLLDNGMAGVFPAGPAVCDKLGLTRLQVTR